MATLNNVRFLNGGYCWQFEWLAGVRSYKPRKFQAVFVAFEHSEHGPCLIDCGYGPENLQGASRWPWILLQWLMPIPRKQLFMSSDYIKAQGLASDINYKIFISHFHPDHVGGLKLFPKATFIYREAAYQSLSELGRFQQLQEGYLPMLLPADFLCRGNAMGELDFIDNQWLKSGLKACDYFGDGSLLIIDLPGHAKGHMGYLLNQSGQQILYVVDAFWDRRAFDSGRKLPWISRQTASDAAAYQNTQRQIRELASSHDLTPIACHCPRTQAYVQTTH